jgi:hypothetical protein
MRKFLTVLFLSLLFSSALFAQIGDPNGGDKPGAPISGIEWLLLGGGIFGARKAYANFRNRK